jgi:hypothetical protein
MKRVLPWLAIVVVLAGTARDAALIRRASPRMAFRNFQEAIVL